MPSLARLSGSRQRPLIEAAHLPSAEWRLFRGDFHATWENLFLGLENPPAEFVGEGHCTYLGKSRQCGTLVLQAATAPGIYPASGVVTMGAENGDKLSFVYGGLLDANTGVSVGAFIFDRGTGRFTDATGGGTFEALIDLVRPRNQPMSVALEGKIDY